MIAAIVPLFFSTDLDRTLSYYRTRLGFETQFEYGEPPHFAGAIRDGLSIFFRHVDHLHPMPSGKSSEELLDAYVRVDDVYRLYAEYTSNRVEFSREIAQMEWGFTEFVVQDCDARLICFGQATELVQQSAGTTDTQPAP